MFNKQSCYWNPMKNKTKKKAQFGNSSNETAYEKFNTYLIPSQPEQCRTRIGGELSSKKNTTTEILFFFKSSPYSFIDYITIITFINYD